MKDTSIQLTLSENEINDLEEAVGWEIEDKEDLYQAVLMAVEKYINDNKTIRVMCYARFNQ